MIGRWRIVFGGEGESGAEVVVVVDPPVPVREDEGGVGICWGPETEVGNRCCCFRSIDSGVVCRSQRCLPGVSDDVNGCGDRGGRSGTAGRAWCGSR